MGDSGRYTEYTPLGARLYQLEDAGGERFVYAAMTPWDALHAHCTDYDGGEAVMEHYNEGIDVVLLDPAKFTRVRLEEDAKAFEQIRSLYPPGCDVDEPLSGPVTVGATNAEWAMWATSGFNGVGRTNKAIQISSTQV